MFYTADQLLEFQGDINAHMDYDKINHYLDIIFARLEEVIRECPTTKGAIFAEIYDAKGNNSVSITQLSEKEINAIVDKLELLGFTVNTENSIAPYYCFGGSYGAIQRLDITWDN